MPERSLSYGYVNLEGKPAPTTNQDYSVVDTTDGMLSQLPVGPDCDTSTGLYAATLQILSLWIEDLPDIVPPNEGLLKLAGRTRTGEDPNIHEGMAVDFNFNVRDRSSAPIGFALGFTNLLLKNRLSLGLQLLELDKNASEYYKRVKDAISPETGRQLIDVLKGVPYLELATSVADGLIRAFGNNESDVVWSSNPVFAVIPAPGAPFLRTGIYVVYENPEDDIRPADLRYQDRWIGLRAESDMRLPRNHLVFSLLIEAAPDKVAEKLI